MAEDKTDFSPAHGSSADSTSVKRVPEATDLTPTMSPIVRRLTELLIIPEDPVKITEKKKRNASVV